MTDVLAEGRKLLAAKPRLGTNAEWDNWRRDALGFFSAHGEALLDCAEAAKGVDWSRVVLDVLGVAADDSDAALSRRRAEALERVAEAVAALNPGDALKEKA